MKELIIIGINYWGTGSTGSMMESDILYCSKKLNSDYLMFVAKGDKKDNTIVYGEKPLFFLFRIINKLFRIHLNRADGFFWFPYTQRITRKIKKLLPKYKNVFIHLNNIHNAKIDLRFLFSFISKHNKIKVFYTIHDMWQFTGGCGHFLNLHCDKWKTGCNNCKHNFDSKSMKTDKQLYLKSKYLHLIKDRLILLPVSTWANEMIGCSYAKDLNSVLINGETNFETKQFNREAFKKELGLENQKIIISVSLYWNEWKGIDYILQIADKLPEGYVILLVGGTLDINNKKIKHIDYVSNEQLYKYYGISDVYLAASQAETFPLSPIEAQMCGVPVVAFGHGGTKETYTNSTGITVGEDNNIEKMVDALIYVVENKPFSKDDIIKNGIKYSKYSHSKKVLELYKKYL